MTDQDTNPTDWIDDALEDFDAEKETFDNLRLPGNSKMTRKELKRKAVLVKRKQKIYEVLSEGLPQPGHVITVGNPYAYDFWQLIPYVVEQLNGVDECYISTWSMAKEFLLEYFKMIDAGKIKKPAMLTDVSFNHRRSSLYTQLVTGLTNRGGRYIAFRNHAKAMLFQKNEHYISIVGSANLTLNPRFELYSISNDQELYEFHQAWMEEMLNG